MISDYEKHIYNLHLKSTRQASNKPFKFRKDFTGIPDKDFVALKKLSNFFNQHKDIDPAVFFISSYKMYKDEKYFDLSYFLTLKAIKAYNIFTNNIKNSDPDSPDQINFTKKSLLFIFNYCREKNINIEDYLLEKTNNINTYFLHLKNRDINIYSLFGFKNLESTIAKSDKEVLRFMFSNDFIEKIDLFKIKFLNSKNCKYILDKGLEIIKKKYKKELNSV